MENQPRGTGTLSKKRYEEISQQFKDVEEDADKVDKLLTIIKTVLNFDPAASNYPFYKAKLKENESTYQQHKKDYYQRNKAAICAKVTEKRRQKRQQTE